MPARCVCPPGLAVPGAPKGLLGPPLIYLIHHYHIHLVF